MKPTPSDRERSLPDWQGAVCPYCHAAFSKRPRGKTICQFCGKLVYLKILPSTRKRALVTEDQARVIEEERTADYQSRALEQWLRRNDLSVDSFRERRAARPALPDGDVIWAMFNEVVHELLKQNDLQGLRLRYSRMALFVAGESREFVYLLKAFQQVELRIYQESGVVQQVRVLSAGENNSCAACLQLDGKIFGVSEAMRAMPLPCKGCTTVVVGTRPGFCRCVYVPIVD